MQDQMELSAASNGFERVNGKWQYNPDVDPSLKKAIAVASIKAKASGKNGNNRTSAYNTRNKQVTMVGAKTGTKYKDSNDENSAGTPIEDLSTARALSEQEFNTLVDANGNIRNPYLRNAIGNGDLSDYEIYVIPAGTDAETHWWRPNETTEEDVYIAIPRDSKRAATDGSGSSSTGSSNGGDNDIPS